MIMGDLITVSILLSVIGGALIALMCYFIEEDESGHAVASGLGGLAAIIIGVLILECNYKKVPIKTSEPPQIDTTIVRRNGEKPDTIYTYKFNPDAVFDS